MAQLQCKTLGGVSPRGKGRVYFACHPEDHKGYFQEISEDLQKYSDCAVYYYDEEPERDEEYYANLERMQLFVMPVTTRLLYLPNRAMDVEFAYAMQHHIPVLPLMQEQGLEDKYAEKIGNLQFLDKENRDLTAIPYEEKLKKYLDGVLLSDEQTAKVRAAFDAWIFLSYRKKDRKAAQELMRLIHNDPRCRDIAIWYDEFLNPGEDFSEAIRKALAESQLFVLAVTPNLLEKGNYVMREEYPEARKAGKPILPAEMEQTDRDALKQDFDGLPEPLNPSANDVLTKAILDALGSMAIRENDEDPRHNFFIGLAYLSGLFVEKDHDRAVRLITQSAEAGLPEAMGKLVTMYESGEGVERNYRKAAAWQQEVTHVVRRRYENNPSIDNAEAYMRNLWELCKKWDTLKEFSLAEKAGKKLCAIAGRLVIQENSDRARYWYVSATDKLATIYQNDGWLWEWAIDWRKLGCKQQEILAQNGNMHEVINLAFSYYRLGDCYAGLAQFYGKSATEERAEKKAWYQKSLETMQSLPESDERHYLECLMNIYIRMGDTCWLEGQDGTALEWFTKAFVICSRWDNTDDDYALYMMAFIDRKIADVYKWKKDYATAELWYTKALKISERWAKKGSIGALRSLMTSHDRLVDLWEKTNNLPMLKQEYEVESNIRAKLEAYGEKKNTEFWEQRLYKLRDICREMGNLEETKFWWIKIAALRKEKALESLKTGEADRLLMDERQLGHPHGDWAEACRRIAELCEEMGDMEGFRAWHRQGIDALKQLPLKGKRAPRWPDSCQWLGWRFRDLELLEEALPGMEFKASLKPEILSFGLLNLLAQIQVLKMPEAKTATDDELDLLFTRARGLDDKNVDVCKKFLRGKPVE